MHSPSSSNIFLQSEVGYNFTYQKLHNVKSSVGTQIGINNSDNESRSIVNIIFKITYDIAFRKSILGAKKE